MKKMKKKRSINSNVIHTSIRDINEEDLSDMLDAESDTDGKRL